MSRATTRTKTSDDPLVAARSWNVLTSPWLDVMDLHGSPSHLSPLDALKRASEIRCIALASPLDLFAAHRFLLTVLYWKADGDVEKLRKSMLKGSVPRAVVAAIADETDRFNLFDAKKPFLQDPRVQDAKRLPASSLFAEMASGTNIAHFHHGDDDASPLCLRCAALGLLRLVPWTQSGGSGKQPALHGAPPIMPLAMGETLCKTLGLNLVHVDRPAGSPQWTGQFRPTSKGARVPLMEGLTWNARRVNLLEPQPRGTCAQCGEVADVTVGPIAFEKNEACKNSEREWRDPAAFYRVDDDRTIKTGREADAAIGDDLRRLFEQRFGKKTEPAPVSQVVAANPTHRTWLVVMPCTNPANNKSFDHRLEVLTDFQGAPPRRSATWEDRVPWQAGDERLLHPYRAGRPTNAVRRFVSAAAQLDEASWGVLANAANRSMDEDPAAFDIFTGLYWPLRNKARSAPTRGAAWIALKLMATAGRCRPSPGKCNGSFQPWTHLNAVASPAKQRRYPRAVPTGDRLEMELRQVIAKAMAESPATTIDWLGLCQFLNEVIQ